MNIEVEYFNAWGWKQKYSIQKHLHVATRTTGRRVQPVPYLDNDDDHEDDEVGDDGDEPMLMIIMNISFYNDGSKSIRWKALSLEPEVALHRCTTAGNTLSLTSGSEFDGEVEPIKVWIMGALQPTEVSYKLKPLHFQLSFSTKAVHQGRK